MMSFTAFLIVLLSLKGTLHCGIDMCLTWGITDNVLELRCKVSPMRFAVSFENPSHQEQAHCLQPVPRSICFTNVKNATVTQNLTQETTVLKIRGHINNSINGQWVCKHGTAFDEAAVNVTFFKEVIYRNNGVSDNRNCIEVYVCWSLVGFVSTTAVVLFITALLKVSNCCKARQRIVSIEENLSNICQLCLPQYPCNEKLYNAHFFQRSVHLVIIGVVIGIPVFVGIFENGQCTDFNGFIILGIVLGVVGSILLDANNADHSFVSATRGVDTEDEMNFEVL